MLTCGIHATVVAKPGHEDDLAALLLGAKALVEDEPGTQQWFAYRLDAQTFGIFDTFDTTEARDAHMNGAVPKALIDHGEWLSGAPTISTVDLLATKLSAGG